MPKSLVSSSAPLCNGAENIQFIKSFHLPIRKYTVYTKIKNRKPRILLIPNTPAGNNFHFIVS